MMTSTGHRDTEMRRISTTAVERRLKPARYNDE
jgi:hypothetical protein